MTSPGKHVSEKTVLIVDDDPSMGEFIGELLNLNHYHVVVAHNGLEAIQATQKGHIDLILMDIHMPLLSGFWYCDTFKHKKNTCSIPIVMVSAEMDEETIEKAHKVGACDTVKKPFTCQEILDAVKKNAT